MGFPSGSAVENLPVNAEDAGLTPGSRRSPGEGKGNPFQYSCLGKFHGQKKSLEGCSPYGHKELNTT